MRIAYLQFAPDYLHVEDNLRTVERLLADVEADLIVLPELFATGYFFQSRDDLLSVVEPVPDGRTTGFSVYALETKDGEAYRLGVMICFDWYFPEAARTLALQGADIIAHPSNLVRPDCPRSMPIRALENHVFTVTANRYGQESSSGESLTFIGQSEICDPQGKILVHAPEAADAVDAVTIDPTNARDRDITTHNHIFDDRRVDQYTIR
jgi:predicted amidohydrolase